MCDRDLLPAPLKALLCRFNCAQLRFFLLSPCFCLSWPMACGETWSSPVKLVAVDHFYSPDGAEQSIAVSATSGKHSSHLVCVLAPSTTVYRSLIACLRDGRWAPDASPMAGKLTSRGQEGRRQETSVKLWEGALRLLGLMTLWCSLSFNFLLKLLTKEGKGARNPNTLT